MKYTCALFSDLDRTILPNGHQPESDRARPLLHELVQAGQIMLVYVSGRHLALLQQAISEYRIPLPHFAVGDVGTTIYRVTADQWQLWPQWSDLIAPDWQGAHSADLQPLFRHLDLLTLQEAAKQNTFKLSYYAPTDIDAPSLLAEMQALAKAQGINASIIWSIDEAADLGLIDVLPASATKLHAVEYLMAYSGLPAEQCVFSGDSGNDLPVVCSGRVQSVLVNNAHPDVIAEAQRALSAMQRSDSLYVARGGWLGMNGNYSAGVLEGLAHFIPAAVSALR